MTLSISSAAKDGENENASSKKKLVTMYSISDFVRVENELKLKPVSRSNIKNYEIIRRIYLPKQRLFFKKLVDGSATDQYSKKQTGKKDAKKTPKMKHGVIVNRALRRTHFRTMGKLVII